MNGQHWSVLRVFRQSNAVSSMADFLPAGMVLATAVNNDRNAYNDFTHPTTHHLPSIAALGPPLDELALRRSASGWASPSRHFLEFNQQLAFLLFGHVGHRF